MNQEIITKAIVIKSVPYKDNDKILTLLTPDHGKISASLRGANKPKAKLKFAGQLFCFAEFDLIQFGSNFTVKTVTEIESFFDISKDFQKLSIGSSILEICDKITKEGETNCYPIFLSTLKALQTLVFSSTSPKLVLVKFMLDAFKFCGYELTMDRCKNCGAKFNGNIFMNIETGAFVCPLCKTEECMNISLGAFNIIKLVSNTEYQNLKSITVHEHHLDEILILLNANFTGKFEIIIKSLKNL